MNTENLDSNFLYQANMANLILLSGQAQKSVDVLFFHDRSYGDFTNLFEIAGNLYRTGATEFIATPNTDGARFGKNIPREASPGMDWTVKHLQEQQVPLESIFHPETPSHHTWEENNSFLELSMKMEWRSGIILAQPHQLLREMLGMVLIMNKSQYQMEIYTAAPIFTPWHEVVYVNQGFESKPRLLNIKNELQRVYEYQQKGDLATFEELFAYLEARERGSLRLGRNLPPQFQSSLLA